MRVLLAGGSGAIGMPLIECLRARGHDVLAIHRSPEGRPALTAAGAIPIQVDVLSQEELLHALRGHRADAVISELTALKKMPVAHKDMRATNLLRVEGTRNLLAAARQLGAGRFVTQSIVFGYGYGDWGGRVMTEADPFGPPGIGRFEEHVAAIRSNEQQVLAAEGMDGIALRYGLLYGPGPASDATVDALRRRRIPVVPDAGPLPWVYLADAVSGTAAALERGARGTAYNLADDEPVSFTTMMTAMAQAVGAPRPRSIPAWVLTAAPYAKAVAVGGLRVSCTRAKNELGWKLEAPSYPDGLQCTAPRYARQAA